MIEIIETNEKNNVTIPMSEMKPMQVGIIVEGEYKGDYVMRTQNSEEFEVMDLSKPYANHYWDSKNFPLEVRLLGPGESITIKLSNY